jgi:hypothetical protein
MRYTGRLNNESAEETIANCLMSDLEIGIIYTMYFFLEYTPAPVDLYISEMNVTRVTPIN